jgi:hypothetical protein
VDNSPLPKILQAEFLFFLKIFLGTMLDKLFRHKKPRFPSESRMEKIFARARDPRGARKKSCPRRPSWSGFGGICAFPTMPLCIAPRPPARP